MKTMQFSVTITAPKAHVWNILWDETTFRQWAGIIDPGTHIVGSLREGSEMEFLSGNGYGVTSLVEKLIPSEYMRLIHQADTQDSGQRTRKKEWTGGAETYTLTERANTTHLTVAFDVPDKLEAYFSETYPLALGKIKALAEQK